MRFHGDQQPEQSEAESENEDAGLVHGSSPRFLPPLPPNHLAPLCSGCSEASWEKEQHLLSPGASVVAPPAASVCLSILQQHSSLLANRESHLSFDWITELCGRVTDPLHLCFLRSNRASFYAHATPTASCGSASY